MKANLPEELQNLLKIVESFKQELVEVSSKKEGFKAINEHLNAAILESEEATKKIIDIIGNSLENLNKLLNIIKTTKGIPEEAINIVNSLIGNLTDALTLLEFQDIMAQRLMKVKGFLSELEKSIIKIALLVGIEEVGGKNQKEIQRKLEELEWRKEVSQKDIDEIMKQFDTQG
jgi:chemotaxis regulatin CheY-phosphate phosphatase CheZ